MSSSSRSLFRAIVVAGASLTGCAIDPNVGAPVDLNAGPDAAKDAPTDGAGDALADALALADRADASALPDATVGPREDMPLIL